jgi:uncharacterized damage-inducible protein DinB
MKPADLRSIYEYLIESRRGFLAKFRELGWDEYTRNREASWQSLHGILVHILEVEDSWIHYDIPGKPWPYGDREPSAFRTFDEVEVYHLELTQKTRTLLNDLTPETLAQEAIFEWHGTKVKSAVENILIHTFIDELAHIGELICHMWQMNTKPPHVNWIEQHLTPYR